MATLTNAPECQRVRRAIIQECGRGVFAAFTGQDSAAFGAFIHGMRMWCCGDARGRAAAHGVMREAMLGMQPRLRYLCRLVIPVVGDHSHVDAIWPNLEIAMPGGAR